MICAECAKEKGWRWPRGHVATISLVKCEVCGEKRGCSGRNDWLKGPEKVLKSWD